MMELWEQAAERSRHAAACGALAPWSTREVTVDDEGVAFSVRVVSSLVARRAATVKGRNPFLEPDPQLIVAECGPAHTLLLNKFPVLEDHLLIVTRAFVPQAGLLDEGDFQALLEVLGATDGLGFYNAGPDAGASQPHRHLQVVRTPISATGGRFPTEARLLDGSAPFPFAAGRMPAAAGAARDVYVGLLERLGRPSAWNLLATLDLLVVVPRARERIGEVSVNALGYAGSLFAGSEAELDEVRTIGPCALLRAVAGGES